MANPMQLRIDLEREEDRRWIGEVPALAGVMAYGQTREEALTAVQALALRVLADRLEHGEAVPEALLNETENGARHHSAMEPGTSPSAWR